MGSKCLWRRFETERAFRENSAAVRLVSMMGRRERVEETGGIVGGGFKNAGIALREREGVSDIVFVMTVHVRACNSSIVLCMRGLFSSAHIYLG